MVIDSEFHCIQIPKCSEGFVQVILKIQACFSKGGSVSSVSNEKMYKESVIVVYWTFLINLSFPDHYFQFELFLDVFNMFVENLF